MSIHFSSKKQDWATPIEFFQQQNQKYGPLLLDVCAVYENTKCLNFINPESNGLTSPWYGYCWMNPPYGREIKKWVARAVEQTNNGNAKRVVCLLPARTDTSWWHEYVMPFAKVVEFVRGRIKFEGAKHAAPFPSAVVVFEKAADGTKELI